MGTTVNFGGMSDPTVRTDWRAFAANLAYERGLVGRVWRERDADGNPIVTTADQWVYWCDSATEPTPHRILVSVRTGGVLCDCLASLGFIQPCAHAGATLVLRARLASEAIPHNAKASE